MSVTGLSLIAMTALATAAAPGNSQGRPITYQSFERNGAYFHCVVADMTRKEVTTQVTMGKGLTPPWKLIGASQPAAALTGTFFAWETHLPVADVLVDGELQSRGAIGSAVAIDWYGNPHIFDTKYNESVDWFPYRYALRGAVRVMTDGHIHPNPRAQRFRDSSIWGRAARTGIGLKPNGKMILMATPNSVTLSEFGGAMRSLGVKDAVSLDGGGSTLLYYRGEMVVKTSRSLSNILVLHERPPVAE